MLIKAPQHLQLVNELFARDAEVEAPRFSAERPWRPNARHLPQREWVYGKNYLLGTVSALIGDGGVGKTSLAIAEAVAITTGRNLIGERTKWSCGETVLYFNGEEPRLEIERRVYAVCQHYKIDPERELLSPRNSVGLHIVSGHDFPICIASAGPRGIIFDSTIVDAIQDYIGSNDIRVLIIDPFVSTHNVPENDNTAINAVVSAWKRLADRCNASVMLVHHTRKPLLGGAIENTVADARGASALIDAVRSARVLNKMTEAEAVRSMCSWSAHRISKA